MLVYFLGTVTNLDEHLPYADTIQDAVIEAGADISNEWLAPTRHRYQKNAPHPERAASWNDMYERNLASIKRADVIIAEVTDQNLPNGILISEALHQNKPVLAVMRNEGTVPLLSHMHHKLLTVRIYSNHNELKKIVQDFLIATANVEMTVTLSLGRNAHQYVEVLATRNNTSKAKVILSLLNPR